MKILATQKVALIQFGIINTQRLLFISSFLYEYSSLNVNKEKNANTNELLIILIEVFSENAERIVNPNNNLPISHL